MDLLSLDYAQGLILRAAEWAKANDGRPVSIAICDANGFLMAFSRMDGAPIRTIQIALGKAYTAIRMGSSTDAFLARLRAEALEIRNFCDPLLTALPGGALLKNSDGVVLASVGISGLAPKDDQRLADYVADLVRIGDA
jgi:uncharacterized protein GlcG (DUF336 family)